MTPTHQTPPTLTVYVPADDSTSSLALWEYDLALREWIFKKSLTQKTIPDPSYINAIINDPGSNDDKVKRLCEYLNTFDNLTKY